MSPEIPFPGYASTVVNDKGEVIDHKDDKNPAIYLGDRTGPIVGFEQEGKEYNIGDKIFEIDNKINTLIELILEQRRLIGDLKKSENEVDKLIDKLDKVLSKIKRGERLSDEDLRVLKSAQRAEGTFIIIKYKLELIEKMFNLHYRKELVNNQKRFLINEIIGKIPIISSQEDPRSGKTLTDFLKEKYAPPRSETYHILPKSLYSK